MENHFHAKLREPYNTMLDKNVWSFSQGFKQETFLHGFFLHQNVYKQPVSQS